MTPAAAIVLPIGDADRLGQHVIVPVSGIAQQLLLQQIQSWKGPFPPPEAMKQYEVLQPGAFDRMLKMAEEAQRAQIETTHNAQGFAKCDIRRGHWLGFVATALAMVGAIACVFMTQPWVAAVFLSVPVMSVARALIESSRQNRAPPALVATPVPDPPIAAGSSELKH